MRITEHHLDRAKELLENPFFDFVVDCVQDDLADEWRGTESQEIREDLHRMTRLLSYVKARMRKMAGDSVVRERALIKLNSRS